VRQLTEFDSEGRPASFHIEILMLVQVAIPQGISNLERVRIPGRSFAESDQVRGVSKTLGVRIRGSRNGTRRRPA
jgi:hypothetical protein